MDSRFSTGALFSAYTTLTAIATLFRQFYNQFVPKLIHDYIASKIKQMFDKPSRKESFTLVISKFDDDMMRQYNLLYNACEAYISDKLYSSATRLRGNYKTHNTPVSYLVTPGEKYVETLEKQGITLVWNFICRNTKGELDNSGNIKSLELCFDIAYKNEVLDGHIPLVVVKYYEDMTKMKKDIHLFTFDRSRSSDWKAVQFNHPFTFDALALDPELKQSVINDLDKFIKRKEFYNRVGRAWKRGYLLYGPPGTGKSSLVAAMANYLRFDVYDLQLGAVQNDATLRKLMFSTTNKSILVIEDIDCTLGMSRAYSGDYNDEFDHDDDDSIPEYGAQDKQETSKRQFGLDSELSLSGLLNFIDGLWSSCGDERIIIFTTNQREKLDPALLRPGRMDMHINMSYLTMPGFKTLVRNYLGITGEHTLFKEIEEVIEITKVTPAVVAEELIRSEDVDEALSSVLGMLKKRLQQSRMKKKGSVCEKTNKLKKTVGQEDATD